MVASPTPWAIAPSIWPWTCRGLMARPTSWAVATCATLAREQGAGVARSLAFLVRSAGGGVWVLNPLSARLLGQRGQGSRGAPLVVEDVPAAKPAAGGPSPPQHLLSDQPRRLLHRP